MKSVIPLGTISDSVDLPFKIKPAPGLSEGLVAGALRLERSRSTARYRTAVSLTKRRSISRSRGCRGSEPKGPPTWSHFCLQKLTWPLLDIKAMV